MRLLIKAGKLFLAYAGVIAATVVVGFLYQAVGLWAAICWGIVVVAGIAYWVSRRMRSQSARPTG